MIRFLITVFPSSMATGYKQNSHDVFLRNRHELPRLLHGGMFHPVSSLV